MEIFVDAIYEEFNQRRKRYAAQEADKNDNDELRELESEINNRKKN